MNLRALEYYRYLPQYNSLNFNSSAFIWKMLNRTIYREGESTWLRNQNTSIISAEDKELKKFGFTQLHSDDKFH
jgi:hypothetical protein